MDGGLLTEKILLLFLHAFFLLHHLRPENLTYQLIVSRKHTHQIEPHQQASQHQNNCQENQGYLHST